MQQINGQKSTFITFTHKILRKFSTLLCFSALRALWFTETLVTITLLSFHHIFKLLSHVRVYSDPQRCRIIAPLIWNHRTVVSSLSVTCFIYDQEREVKTLLLAVIFQSLVRMPTRLRHSRNSKRYLILLGSLKNEISICCPNPYLALVRNAGSFRLMHHKLS